MCKDMAFVGIDEDSCIVSIITDNPIDMVRIVDTAKTIVEWVEEGLDIKRIDVEEAKKYFGTKYIE